MAKRSRILCSAIAALGLSHMVLPASGETLPVPGNLVSFHSEQGQSLLFSSEAYADYGPLSNFFVTQDNPAYCGPASIAMVLNALEIPRPASSSTDGYGLFNQDNIFNKQTERVKRRKHIKKSGMSLSELGDILATFDLNVASVPAGDSSLRAFRTTARSVLEDDHQFILVNYLRSSLGQKEGGHISPLAAYDADTDMFLIMDVSRYKYPPVWVRTRDIFDAMNEPVGEATRGYVVLSR